MTLRRIKAIRTFRLTLLVAIALFGLVTILGKGGGGEAPPEPPGGSSNWDTMVWDQDNWG
jgi:hypothetical protein